jgi:hypothetical protein
MAERLKMEPLREAILAVLIPMAASEIRFAIAADTARFVTWGFRGISAPASPLF